MSSELGPELKQAIDLVSDKHGPKMLSLKAHERSWILKVRKTVGHPSPAKLKQFCQQMGRSTEIIEALDDLRCSTCAEAKGPEIATIHVL